MAYVGVVKALYDYDAQNPEDEISFKEDQVLYIVEKGDDEWWKAKLKDENGGEGAVGLVPCTYVEEMPPTHQARSMYAYESTSPEELTIDADVDLNVYAEEDDWILVSVVGAEHTLGFVPKNYCEPLDGAADEDDDGGQGAAVGAAVAAGGVTAAAAAAAAAAARQDDERARAAAKQRELALKDKVESWSISELDGKKKKKGSLSVGNGTIFFSSDSDKSPIKQYPISDLTRVEQEGSKVIALSISVLPSPLRFHTGNAKTTQAIVEKLASSKQVAGDILDVEANGGADSSDDETAAAPVAAPPASVRRVSEPKTVRFTEPDSPVSPVSPPGQANGVETCLVLYDFEAKGDDELTIEENQRLTIVDRSDDEWWLVRNAQGHEGVVPAQYVELEAGSAANGAPAADPEAERRREAEAKAQAAAAAAAAERQRKEEAARREQERKAREASARERSEQEALDRELAEQIEAEEREKRRIAEDRERQQQEFDAMRRRQAARQMGGPPLPEPKRRLTEPQVIARDILAEGRAERERGESPRDRPVAPRPDQRPKPNPARVRTWSDRTGQFTVEAEFLGLNGNKLRLHKTNGVIIEVPMEKMSNEDVNIIKRYQARKKEKEKEKERSERSATLDDEDTPLGWNHPPRRPSANMSSESQSRQGSQAIQAQRTGNQRKRPTFDWFAFFLEAGCDMDDCTRYSANFERDRIDETILTDLDASTMRSLGLREGDVIRVRKHIQAKYGKKTPEQESQISKDEELARQLQDQENGSKGAPAAAPPGLFTGPNGRLANNTRRGRPERRNTITDSVDPTALAAATDQLAKVSLTPLEPSKPPPAPAAPAAPPVSVSPPPEEKKEEEKPKSGFDDDAWAIKPVAKQPSPAPAAAATPPPAPANGTDALLAQIQSMRPASTGPPPGGSAFESIAAANAAVPQRTGSANLPPPSSYGLGATATGVPMSQLQAQSQQQAAPPVIAAPPAPAPPVIDINAPRGPLAPVPANQGLLQPMTSQTTGMFVPTHGSGTQSPIQSPFAGGVPAGQYLAAAGMQPMVTGMQQPMMQPMYTGFQQPQSTFNAIASIPPPQVPQPTGTSGDKFAPSNIFNAMKRTEYGKREEENPQPSNKYDALRPLTTGYNGAPGVYPQATGMGMQPGMQMQPTGMMPMGMQQTGMMMQPGMQQQGMYPGTGMYMGQGYGY